MFLRLVQGLARTAGYPVGPSDPIPFSDVSNQESTGNSVYHALTVSFSKRFSKHFEFLSSYTFSHTIDDATDLESPLNPQNNRLPNLDRSNSTFDRRHRWVTSAVFESPYKRSDYGWWRKFLADFTVAPIIDVSSGVPFNVLTGTDYNLDFGPTTDRPSVASSGGTTSSFLPGVHFVLPDVCPSSTTGLPPISAITATGSGCAGNLGRNHFMRPSTFTMDLRIARKFFLSERWNVQVIAEGFNLLNRTNISDVNPLCDPGVGKTCFAGQPTAALDPRQFQFALKLNW